MGIRNVPTSIKDPNLSGFLRELRAAIGGVSDQVTKLVQTKSSSGGGGGGGGGGTDPGTDPPPGGGGGDGYPPPAPTSLQAIPGAFSITLVWTNPVIPDLQATEVWARRSFSAWVSTYEYLANAKVLVNGVVYRSKKSQDVNSTTNVVTLNKGFNPPTSPDWWEATTLAATEKSKVGESAGLSWIHDGLTPGETWAYWVRNRDVENLFSTFFPDDDVGVITTTLLDPKAYLDLLTNSITATQLYSDLGRRINLIDGPIGLDGSVQNRVAAEALARETGIYNESVIRKNGDDQLASTLSVVSAKTDNNAAAIATEITARTTADSALAQRIDVVVAKTDANAAAITSEQTARVNADGALGQRIDQVQAVGNSNSALITDIKQARIGYCTIGGRTSEHGERSTCEAAGGTWNIGLPWANAVKQVSVTVPGVCYKDGAATGHTSESACSAAGGTWTPGGSTALEQQFTAQQQVNGRLYSQYTIKLDTNGWVSGFGLANAQQSDGTVISDFGVRADRFWVAPPTSPGNLSALGIPLVDFGGGRCVSTVPFVIAPGGVTRYWGYFRTSDANDLAEGDFLTLRDVRISDRLTKHNTWNGTLVVRHIGSFTYDDYSTGSKVTKSSNSFPYLSGNTTNLVAVLLETAPVEGDGYNTSSSTPPNDDKARAVPGRYLPFVITTTKQWYNNVPMPIGVYMNAAYIVDASITNAKIYGDIRSADYNGAEAPGGSGYGTAGWCINKLGQAVFNNGVWRNWIRSKNFDGTLDSGGTITGVGTEGWAIDQQGNAVFNRVIVRKAGNIDNYVVTNVVGESYVNTLNGITASNSTGVTLSIPSGAQSLTLMVDAAAQAASGQSAVSIILQQWNGSSWESLGRGTTQAYGLLGDPSRHVVSLAYSYTIQNPSANSAAQFRFRISASAAINLYDRGMTAFLGVR